MNTQIIMEEITNQYQTEAAEINRLHNSIIGKAKMLLKEVIELGGILTTVKNKLKHGEWGEWQKQHLSFHERTASRYMRCYDNRDQLKLDSVSDLNEAYQLLNERSTHGGKGRGSTHRRVKQNDSTGNVAMGQVTREMLSMSAQEKVERTIARERKELQRDFRAHVVKYGDERTKTYLENLTPTLQAEREQHRRLMNSRRGFIEKKVFRLIQACLHPDWVTDSTQKDRYAFAFREFTKLEKFVLDEKDSPTEFVPLPKTMAEWDAQRAAVTAARKAARKAKNAVSRSGDS